MSAECIACQNPVRALQEGLQCDGCFRWQHRTCGTGISQCDYRFAVQTGASIDWRCVTCMSLSESMPVAESTPVDFTESMSTLYEPLADPAESTPIDFTESMSTLYEPLADPAADESSILEPLPAPAENDSSFALTFQILEDCTTKGTPKLIDSRGYCYNVKRCRAHATDWQCTVRPKVTVIKLSYVVFSREMFTTIL